MDFIAKIMISFCSVIFLIKPFNIWIIPAAILMVILLMISGLVSGSEMAFFSLTAAQIKEIGNKKSRINAMVVSLLGKPQKLLATILISNSFINIAIVIISTFITNKIFDFSVNPFIGFILQFVVIASLILLIGEIMPKIIASKKPKKYVFFISPLLHFLVKLFHPVSELMIRSTGIIEKRISRKGHNISINELTDAIEIASEDESHEQEQNILRGIVKFADIEVKEVMKSRVDVTAIEFDLSLKKVMEIVLESAFSRIPVYEESIDKVVGILYIKDLLSFQNEKNDFKWQKLIRPALFIPENKKISDMLMEFKEKKIHIAVVVDEYGGTSGIVTMEDIIEEIFGEINDEFDDEPIETYYSKVDENTYIFEGKTSMNDFFKITECHQGVLNDFDGEFDSLAGLILEITGKIPEKYEVVNFNNFRFTIMSSDSRRIKQVKVEIIKERD